MVGNTLLYIRLYRCIHVRIAQAVVMWHSCTVECSTNVADMLVNLVCLLWIYSCYNPKWRNIFPSPDNFVNFWIFLKVPWLHVRQHKWWTQQGKKRGVTPRHGWLLLLLAIVRWNGAASSRCCSQSCHNRFMVIAIISWWCLGQTSTHTTCQIDSHIHPRSLNPARMYN